MEGTVELRAHMCLCTCARTHVHTCSGHVSDSVICGIPFISASKSFLIAFHFKRKENTPSSHAYGAGGEKSDGNPSRLLSNAS